MADDDAFLRKFEGGCLPGGGSVLSVAVQCGFEDLVEELMASGGRPNKKDMNAAVYQGSRRMMKLFAPFGFVDVAHLERHPFLLEHYKGPFRRVPEDLRYQAIKEDPSLFHEMSARQQKHIARRAAQDGELSVILLADAQTRASVVRSNTVFTRKHPQLFARCDYFFDHMPDAIGYAIKNDCFQHLTFGHMTGNKMAGREHFTKHWHSWDITTERVCNILYGLRLEGADIWVIPGLTFDSFENFLRLYKVNIRSDTSFVTYPPGHWYHDNMTPEMLLSEAVRIEGGEAELYYAHQGIYDERFGSAEAYARYMSYKPQAITEFYCNCLRYAQCFYNLNDICSLEWKVTMDDIVTMAAFEPALLQLVQIRNFTTHDLLDIARCVGPQVCAKAYFEAGLPLEQWVTSRHFYDTVLSHGEVELILARLVGEQGVYMCLDHLKVSRGIIETLEGLRQDLKNVSQSIANVTGLPTDSTNLVAQYQWTFEPIVF